MEMQDLIELSIRMLKEYNTHNQCYILDSDLVKFRKLSIQLINNNESSLVEWIEQLKLLEIKKKYNLPIEAFLVISREINIKYDNELSKYTISLDEFSTLLIERLLAEVHFAIEKEKLYNLVKKIKTNNNNEYKKRILIKKISKLKKIDIEYTENCILGLKFENFSKLELVGYLNEEINLYYIPNNNIEIIDIKNGHVIKQISEDNRALLIDKSSYINLIEYLSVSSKENDRNDIIFNLNNQYERMLIYSFVKYYIEFYNEETEVTTVRNDIIENIIRYKDLLSSEYQIKLLNKANTEKYINTYIEKLKNNPTNRELRNIIKECNDIDWIFEILKLAPEIINEEISIDTHIAGIVKCRMLDRHNIKIALYCEEIIKDKHIINEDILGFLVSMYKEGIYTKTTESILKYLKCTIKDNTIIDEAQIKVMVEQKHIDNDLIDKFIKVYNNIDNINNLDDTINKIINREDNKINEKLYSIVYEFYKRNNDIRALDLLCKTMVNYKDDLTSIGINNKDIIKLLNYFINLKKYEDKEYVLRIIKEFRYDKDVISKAIRVLGNMGMLNPKNIEEDYSDIYFDIISIAKKHSKILKEIYLSMLIDRDNNYKYNLDEIVFLLNTIDLENLKSKEDLKMISVVINYYISTSNNIKALKYLNIYLEKLSNVDSGELFKEILSSYNNLDFIEDILKQVDFINIEKVDLLLNIIFDKLVQDNRYEYLIEILRYYVNTKRYSEGLYVLRGYISNISYIDDLNYQSFILPILRNISDITLKEIYDILIKRDDLPVNIREEFYNLNTTEENTNKIINEFEKGETHSILAKNLSLRKYYNNDDKFQELINNGDNDSDTCKIVFEKIKEKFKDNKGYVELIIPDEICKLDNKLKKIKEYAVEYNENLFNPENQHVFGEFFVNQKIDNELCNKMKLKNIFTNEESDAVLFKDSILYDIYIKYLNDNNIKFDEIDLNVINVNYHVKWILPENLSLVDILKNFNKLVILQRSLMQNSIVMLEFSKNSFKLSEKGFILNSFAHLYEYNGEFVLRKNNIFENIHGIRNKNNRIIINEKNITKIMCEYIKNMLLDRKILEKDANNNIESREIKIRNKFINEILNIKVSSLDELYDIISSFIYNENKEFEDLSYRKQISMFDDLNYEEKILVISKAIKDSDTTPIIRKKIIYFDDIPEQLIDSYFVYLIDCFNNTLDLEQDDYEYIYDKVTNLLKLQNKSESKFALNETTIKNQETELETLYIDSINICKFRVRDVKKDIENLKNIDVEYILSRLDKM